MIILKALKDLTLMKNILQRELPQSITVMLFVFFYKTLIFVWQKTTLCLTENVTIAGWFLKETPLNIVSSVICVPFSSAEMASSLLFWSFSLLHCVLRSRFLEECCISSTTTRVVWRCVLTPGLHSLLPFVTVKNRYSTHRDKDDL